MQKMFIHILKKYQSKGENKMCYYNQHPISEIELLGYSINHIIEVLEMGEISEEQQEQLCLICVMLKQIQEDLYLI